MNNVLNIGDVEIEVHGPSRDGYVWPTYFCLGDTPLNAKAFYDLLIRRNSWQDIVRRIEELNIVYFEDRNDPDLGSKFAIQIANLIARNQIENIDLALASEEILNDIKKIGEPGWIYHVASAPFNSRRINLSQEQYTAKVLALLKLEQRTE